MKFDADPTRFHVALFRADFAVETVSDGIAAFFRRWPEFRGADPCDVPQPIADFVRNQVESYRRAGEFEATALYGPTLLVRVSEVVGPGKKLIAAVFAPFVVRDPVAVATKRFKLTERERQVLTLMLTGLRAAEIAAKLQLSEMTVGDYFKRLRAKTAARTQSGMIATLLGWSSGQIGVLDTENVS